MPEPLTPRGRVPQPAKNGELQIGTPAGFASEYPAEINRNSHTLANPGSPRSIQHMSEEPLQSQKWTWGGLTNRQRRANPIFVGSARFVSNST